MKRIFWLDASRVVAIVLVVITHCHERADLQSPLVQSVFFTIDRLGVPLFFMISGGLILPKLIHRNIGSFYLKRIPQFFLVLFVWTVATNFMKNYVGGKNLWQSLVLAFTTTNGIYPARTAAAEQMWFMYTIILLYLVAPFVAKLLHALSNAEILLFLFLCVLFNECKNSLNILGGGIDILGKMGTDFTGPYLAYFLLGYLIIDRSLFYGRSWLWPIGYVLAILIPVFLLIYIEQVNPVAGKKLHWYSNSIFILVSSVGLFLLLKWLFLNVDGQSKLAKWTTIVSLCSFGIFLTHYVFIYMAIGIFKPWLPAMTDIHRVVLFFAVSFSASLLLVYWMRKSKITSYLVA